MRDEEWLIVDTETDGLFDPVHVVEIAAQKMRGWQRCGDPFSILINHDVRIDPAAQAVHGYSREYLRQHGERPHDAHAAFREYSGDLPVVAYNISFDWNRALEPEYRRLGLTCTGRRGFCAMTLSRRAIKETPNFKLDTLKDHFSLNDTRSHIGRNDVDTLVNLFERVLAHPVHTAGIIGFDAVAEFSRRTPVASCQEIMLGVGEPVWYVLDALQQAQGPFYPSAIRELTKESPVYVWREGMVEWTLSDSIPDFVPPAKKRRTGKRLVKPVPEPEGTPDQPLATTITPEPAAELPKHTNATSSSLDHERWINELIGLSRGVLADGVVNTAELMALQEWLMSCPCTQIYPISVVAQVVEDILADGVITEVELEELRSTLELILPNAKLDFLL